VGVYLILNEILIIIICVIR